jgi:hypothetical protein
MKKGMNKGLWKIRSILFLAVIVLMPAGIFARGVTSYLPLNMSPEIERQIERILILAGKPVMTRPIAVETVLDALPDARKLDEELYNKVERYLERYTNKVALAHLRAEVAADAGDSEQILPNQYGKQVDSTWQVSGEFYFQPSEYVLVNLGGIAYDGHATPTGSMLSLGIDYAQLDIGYREHWMSPFTDSSMLLSTEAPTMPSVTLSNYRPISGLGLSYQLYLAEMSESGHILYQNRFTTGKPRLAGVHLKAEPVEGYAIGLNRQLQFGGGERDQDSMSDFMSAFFNPAEYDNPSVEESWRNEFGNQQASVTARIMFPGKTAFAVYFEYAGEDTSRYQNYLLGNTSLSFGIDFPSLWNKFDFTYETTEWQNLWYVHDIYTDGLLNQGNVIGHWFGDQRQSKDAPGGVSHMLRLEWQVGDSDYLQAVYRTLKNNAYTSVDYENMRELGLAYSFPWKGHLIGAEMYAGSDVLGSRYLRLNASLNFGQDWPRSTSGDASSAYDADDSVDLFIDMGVTQSKIKTDRGYADDNLADWKNDGGNAYLGFGVRRAVSEHSDLGTRIEWDRLAGCDIFSIRMMDYRYRIDNHFALSGFLGVGRYDFGTPAYGWYLGMGPQLLNVLPKWNICLDARLHLKMVRDKDTNLDAPGSTKPDIISSESVTVYVSRGF